MLQARWAVLRGPAYGWNREQLGNIMTACIIMHNMIIEDEKGDATNISFDNIGHQADISTGSTNDHDRFVRAKHKLRNSDKHHQLQWDLIEHNWTRHGSN